MTKIVNREREFVRLQRAADTPPELVIMRGRRRIGKSFLLARSLAERRTVFFQADERDEAEQLRLFGSEVGRLLAGGTLHFESWDAAFEYLERQASQSPLVVVLDEFQWALKAQPALDSIIQRHWDRWQRENIPVTLVLSGSALSLMESLLHYSNPLHGRSTYRPYLQQLDYRYASEFAGKTASSEEKLRRYAVIGGTPQYQVWAGEGRLEKIIRERILTKEEPLYAEPFYLLREEETVRDPGTYFSIMSAIASGCTQNSQIANRVGLPTSRLAKLLDRLQQLGYVSQRWPIGPKEKKLRAIYVISDSFFRFWFRYVLPKRSRLEVELVDEVYKEIDTDLDNFMGPSFEECCQDWLRRFASENSLPVSEEIGSYWTRTHDLEIDVVGFSGRNWNVLGSCKWSKRADSQVLEKLLESQRLLGQRAANAKLIIFARGFRQDLVNRAALEDVRLISVDDLFT